MRNSIYRSFALAVAIAIATLASMACNDDDSPSAPEPEPEPPTVTETFQGDIEQAETSCHDFTLMEDGDVTLEIRDLQPLSTLTVGLGIGQPDSSLATGCALFVQDNSVRVNQTLLAANLLAGDFCACIFDVGNIFPGETVTYTFEVTHP